MKLTKKSEYAIRAMLALTRNSGESMTISQIAAAQKIPKKFLEQILLALKAAGLLVSRAGPRGGYALAGDPQQITVGQILQAVEEPISLREHFLEQTNGASSISRVETVLMEIRDYVRRKLDGISLAELSAQDMPADDVEALMWYI